MSRSASTQGEGSPSSRAQHLSAGEIFALERQFLRDRDLPDSELTRRDREIGRTLLRVAGPRGADRRALCRGWLRNLGEETARDASRMERAVASAALGLIGCGALTGAGAAAGLLHYEGGTPINLFHFVGVFVVLQLLTLVVWVVALATWRRGRGPRGAVATILGGALRALLRLGLCAERRAALQADLDTLRRIGGWYSEIERWSLARLAQLFGVAFNVGALGCAALLMAGSDLAFAWRSTIDWHPDQIHVLLRVLSMPWARALPEAVPSRELVEASHHFRGAGAPTLAPELMARWWSFLLLSVACYGLVPRALTWLIAEIQLRRALRGIDLERGELADLHDRLTRPLVETPGREGPAPPACPTPGASSAEPAAGRRAWGIVWRDAPIDRTQTEQLASARLGWRLERLVQAGGGTNPSVDRDSLAALGELPPESALLLFAESFDPPTQELLQFLATLRAGRHTDPDLVVCLIAPDPERGWQPAGDREIAIWRAGLAPLASPRLRVVTLLRSDRG